MIRDLVGYGGDWPDFRWPNGSWPAVSVAINFEEGAERQVLDGNAENEKIGEVISMVPEGRPDPGQAQVFSCGTRAGAWRMKEALKRHSIPATLFVCGRAAERAAPVLSALVAHWCEAACHDWLWRAHADYDSSEEEAADLDRAAAGETPKRFFCRGAESPWTRGPLAERGYAFTSNAFDDDPPYRDPSGLVVVPCALDSNDMKFFHPNGFVRSGEMADYVRGALYVLECDVGAGLPRLLNIGFHLRIVGCPGCFAAFEEILVELDRRRDRVWLARRIDIARAFAEAV